MKIAITRTPLEQQLERHKKELSAIVNTHSEQSVKPYFTSCITLRSVRNLLKLNKA